MYRRQQQSTSSANNPFKRPHSNYIPQRSETPISNLLGATHQNFPNPKNYDLNRSISKLPSQDRNYPPQFRPTNPNNNNLSRSRISVQSSASQLAFLNNEQGDIFPQDLIFLLRNEEKNINNFKNNIEKQKEKVENDFAVFLKEVEHILQDVKISVQAELDLVYKTFITKYAQLKGEVQELRQLRKEILMNNIQTNKNFNSLNTSSNQDLIGQIEKDAEQFKNYKVYGYLSELQKQKLSPILALSNEIIVIGSVDCPFYRNKEMNLKLKDVRANFGQLLTDVYNNIHDYITTPQAIIEKQKAQEQNANMILKEMNENIHQNQFSGMNIIGGGGNPNNNHNNNAFDQHFPNNYSNISYNGGHNNKPQSHQGWNNNNQHNLQTMGQKLYQTSNGLDWGKVSQNHNQQKNHLEHVGCNQQTSVTKYGDTVNFNHKERIVTDHTDSILCTYFIDMNHIATGSKDKTINIYSLEGTKKATLRGHSSAICCLSSVKTLNGDRFLASGSDHGCSSLILWNTRTWDSHSKVVAHTAAVTSIVDLQDGIHLVTGSYDKKINLFNHAKGTSITSLSNNRTSVTSMIMTCDRSRLVSSGLDNSLSIWQIQRKNNIVESIIPQLSISNDSLICQLQPCILKPQLIFAATRNGHLKVYNVKTGEQIKSLVVNSNSIIELVTIEREMKPDGPMVLSCSSKDSNLLLTKIDSSVSSPIRLQYNAGIEFGCGIGPKVVFNESRGGVVAVLNQSQNQRELSIYEVDIK